MNASLLRLRQERRASILKILGMARTTIRAQRTELARIAKEWRAVTKRINAAVGKYERSVDDLGIFATGSPLDPRDLIGCMKGCASDEQTDKLDEIETELAEHQKEIIAAGKERDRKRTKTEKRRERADARRARVVVLR